MECLYPFRDKSGTWFPCGHCIPCRIRKSREWTVRILHEYETFNYQGLFITLTYKDEFLPVTDNNYATLRKKDLQKYIKRVRKALNGRRIKYFACGEYGEECLNSFAKHRPDVFFKHGRPHYHIIMLGVDYDDVYVLRKEWQFDDDADWRWSLPHYDPIQKKVVGYSVNDISVDSIRYVVGYVQKKWHGKKFTSPFVLSGCENYFQIVSQGFGLDWLKDHYSEVIDNPVFSLETRNGIRKIGLPQYYKRKLGLDAKGRRKYLLRDSDDYNRYIENLEQYKAEYECTEFQKKSELRQNLWKSGVRGVEFISLMNNVDVNTAELLLHKRVSYSEHAKNFIYEDFL